MIIIWWFFIILLSYKLYYCRQSPIRWSPSSAKRFCSWSSPAVDFLHSWSFPYRNSTKGDWCRMQLSWGSTWLEGAGPASKLAAGWGEQVYGVQNSMRICIERKLVSCLCYAMGMRRCKYGVGCSFVWRVYNRRGNRIQRQNITPT